MNTEDLVVDSNLLPDEAVRSNPNKLPCPRSILRAQCLVTVHHYGFDGKLHRGQIVVQEDVTTDIHDLFSLIEDSKFPLSKVVPLAHPDYLWDPQKTVLKDNLTYGFNYRYVNGTERLSQHAFGRAVDINPMQNPYIRRKDGEEKVWPPVKWSPKAQGVLHAGHPIVHFWSHAAGSGAGMSIKLLRDGLCWTTRTLKSRKGAGYILAAQVRMLSTAPAT